MCIWWLFDWFHKTPCAESCCGVLFCEPCNRPRPTFDFPTGYVPHHDSDYVDMDPRVPLKYGSKFYWDGLQWLENPEWQGRGSQAGQGSRVAQSGSVGHHTQTDATTARSNQAQTRKMGERSHLNPTSIHDSHILARSSTRQSSHAGNRGQPRSASTHSHVASVHPLPKPSSHAQSRSEQHSASIHNGAASVHSPTRQSSHARSRNHSQTSRGNERSQLDARSLYGSSTHARLTTSAGDAPPSSRYSQQSLRSERQSTRSRGRASSSRHASSHHAPSNTSIPSFPPPSYVNLDPARSSRGVGSRMSRISERSERSARSGRSDGTGVVNAGVFTLGADPVESRQPSQRESMSYPGHG